MNSAIEYIYYFQKTEWNPEEQLIIQTFLGNKKLEDLQLQKLIFLKNMLEFYKDERRVPT